MVWAFKVKTNENGDVERYKARLVSQGFMQVKRCWNSTLDDYLKQFGFVRSINDPCIYVEI